MSLDRNEVISVDAVLEFAEHFAATLPNEDNAAHLHRLIKLAARLPARSDDTTTDRDFAERLGLYFAIYKMLDSYMRATLPDEIVRL